MRHTEEGTSVEGHERATSRSARSSSSGSGSPWPRPSSTSRCGVSFELLEAREAARRTLPPLAASGLRRTPPAPRLEPDALLPRRRMVAEENAALTTYGWVDRDAGIVRIPIERAMELLAERGLPPSKPLAVLTPVPGTARATTPGAGTP